MGVPRDKLGDYPGVTVWREVSPGYYLPAEPTKSSATWPQAVMIAWVIAEFVAAIVWAIAWAVK